MSDGAQEHFDRWAPSYEADRRSRWLARFQQEALSALELQPQDRFLDVGCGSGAAVRVSAARVERAVGVDLSPGMISRARHLAGNLSSVEFRLGDSEHLPARDGEFTAVICTSSFHHYPHPRESLQEMHRVLSAGGRLAIADANGDMLAVRIADFFIRMRERDHVGFYRAAKFDEMLRSAGFEQIITRPMKMRYYALTLARKPI